DTEPEVTTPVTPSKKSSGTPETKEMSQDAEGGPKTPAKQTTVQTPQQESDIPQVTGDVICENVASLHLFDAAAGVFIEQADNVNAKIIDLGGFEYWLEVSRTNDGRKMLGLPVSSDMNPCFNFEHSSFIFNYFSNDTAFSWLIKFPSFEN